jgi:hypothetical protein
VQDDDGIIDLAALSKPTPAIAQPVFTSEPPPAAFALEAPGQARPPRTSTLKIVALIAGALVFMTASGIGLRLLFRGEDPISRTAPPPPPPQPVVAAAPPPAVDPPPTASEEPAPPPKAKKTRGGAGKFVRPAATPKAADPCGCKGNFDCNLRCAAAK